LCLTNSSKATSEPHLERISASTVTRSLRTWAREEGGNQIKSNEMSQHPITVQLSVIAAQSILAIRARSSRWCSSAKYNHIHRLRPFSEREKAFQSRQHWLGGSWNTG
jgi:hypothetical protein